jgi:dGTPase
LEVAQIAKSIAIWLNEQHSFFKRKSNQISTDIVEIAALAHDLGHPPFGHNGETALDECMIEAGGFEGNAQTLRIIAKLEKRETSGHFGDGRAPVAVANGIDQRVGLNLTYRTLAAVLKYDDEIPRCGADRDQHKPGIQKGYYYTEAALVAEIKKHVGSTSGRDFRTIECSIMDLADDIAYSTYDLEDAFKARFLSPASILAIPDTLAKSVAQRVRERLQKFYPAPEYTADDWQFDEDDVFSTIIATLFETLPEMDARQIEVASKGGLHPRLTAAEICRDFGLTSDNTASNGYLRTKFTSELVKSFIHGIEVRINKKQPALSTVMFDIETFKRVEVFKNLVYQSLIMSSMLKVTEFRGKDVVRRIFQALKDHPGYMLMPPDFRGLYEELKAPNEKLRVVCDFIAGMTDRYAIQFYNRIYGTIAETIYSPL